MQLNTSPKTFIALNQNLEYCDFLFLQHQIYLMYKNIQQAVAVFEQLIIIRDYHLDIMETILLPAFEQAVQQIPEGAKPLYFIREKKLILKHLNKHIRNLGHVLLHSENLNIVSLFEEYAWLKDLLDHHDAREKAFLFPLLDEKLTSEKKEELLNLICKQLSEI